MRGYVKVDQRSWQYRECEIELSDLSLGSNISTMRGKRVTVWSRASEWKDTCRAVSGRTDTTLTGVDRTDMSPPRGPGETG